MVGEKNFQDRGELRRMANGNLWKTVFCQKEKKCVLGGVCPFLLEYQYSLFCVSEIMGRDAILKKQDFFPLRIS
jgi:hypothetical protein